MTTVIGWAIGLISAAWLAAYFVVDRIRWRQIKRTYDARIAASQRQRRDAQKQLYTHPQDNDVDANSTNRSP